MLTPNSVPDRAATSGNIIRISFIGSPFATFFLLPALSFMVNSDTQITATAPPGFAGMVADVTVTTAGGTSPMSPMDRYSYVTAASPTHLVITAQPSSVVVGTP